MAHARELLTILYVQDLPRARAFYGSAFEWPMTVDVPNYVEYEVCQGARLGLMPQANTTGFLGPTLGKQVPSDGCPRAEVYVSVDDADEAANRLLGIGATCTSPLQERDWGDRAAYFMDLDGYVIAVADRQNT